MNKKTAKSFSARLAGGKTFYLATVFALAAVALAALLIAPSFTGSATQAARAADGAGQGVTAEMLRVALDLRSATEYRVYGNEGVKRSSSATIEGGKAEASRDAVEGARVRKDLGDAFNIINQLPATDVKAIGGAAYRAGVYASPSGKLAGEITLDGEGNQNAIFVFKLGSDLAAGADVHFSLVNGAEAQNVFFISKGAAAIADGVEFRGSVLAEGAIRVGDGARVSGRTLSLGGEVELKGASAVAGGTGVLEICKEEVESGLTVFGITAPAGGAQLLFSFNSNDPANAAGIAFISGLPTGVSLVGIDFRPSTSTIIIQPEGPILGVLYGVGSNSALYTINQFTGVATLVGPLGVALSGTEFGVDFNPTNDQLRVVSNTGQNLSVDPNTGTATAQTALNPAPGTGVSGSAYSNNFAGATSTTLYDINTDSDTLVIQNTPASGTLTTVGSLGVNASAVNGFDIAASSSGGPTTAGLALAALTTTPAGQTGSTLFRINLATGAATFVGNIGTGLGFTVRGLAIAPGGSTGLGNPNGLGSRIFVFTVGGITVQVPVGGCSGPITLPAGPVTITELADGFLIPSGTFSGRFRLVDVESSVAGSLGTVNLTARTAVVNIREGDINNQTVVTFFNQFAISAVIEICKRASAGVASGGGVPTGADSPDVTGFFDFTIDSELDRVISVPVGFCSGPLTVNVPTTPGPFPAPADVIVTELGRPGFTLETVTTFPSDRLNFVQLGFGIDNSNPDCITASETPFVSIPAECIFSNPGGGFASGDVLEGGTASQTTFNFFNRVNPAVLKICKVAGPGIPIGTPFTFEVRGTVVPFVDADGDGFDDNADALGNDIFQDPPFAPTAIGTIALRNVTVLAGPGAQGGFCEFVRDLDGTLTRFVVGTPIAVNETGFTTPIPGVGPGQVRTASIRSNTGFSGTTNPLGSGTVTTTTVGTAGAPPAGTSSNLNAPGTNAGAVPGGVVTTSTANGGNPDLEFVPNIPNRFLGSLAIVPARATTVEVEFVNFVFNPTVLKICKVAGAGIPDDGTRLFTFTTTITNPATLRGPTFDPRLAPTGATGTGTTAITTVVAAGPASQGGFCQFVGGPFTQTSTVPAIGTFSVGTTVTIAETGGTTGTVIPTGGITSPTGTVISPNVTTRTGGLVLGFTGGFNEITFVNATAPGGGTPLAPRPAFDFDGDGKSDPTVFRAASATWWYAASSAGGQHRATQFGLAIDKDNLVAADYDGDLKTDYAVFRKEGNFGIWYINGSTSGFRAEQFGLATDIPQTGDFDGDGKADLAVFRPSTGVWYMMNSQRGFSAVQFGAAGDKPVAADFDGDGKTDQAVYRGEGIWHLLRSQDGYTSIKFGLTTAVDTPVAADYDGDRKADLAVFRAGGTWHLLRTQAGYVSHQFGQAGDKAVPADYNGDGKTDLAVFRSGAWHMMLTGQGESGASYNSFEFGNSADTPAAVR